MEKKIINDIAFFNILKNFIPAKFKYKAYTFSLSELAEKLGLEELITRNLIKDLHDDALVEIIDETPTTVTISFETSYEHILEVFSINDIENLIKDMQIFIRNNYNYFTFDDEELNSQFRKYSKEAADLIFEKGLDANLNPIISNGITEILSVEKNNLYLKKRIYDMCNNNPTPEELKILEAILFCDVNFPKTNNPFYVTLFLTKLVLYLNEVKK